MRVGQSDYKVKKTQDWVEERTGYRFRDESLLRQALTHRSASQGAHNERLEFLGDALLNFIVAEVVYRQRTDDDEGSLSRLRSSLVRGATLAEIGAELGLGEHLIMGSGELKSGGSRRRSMLADGFEALLGAMYLDGGIEAVRACVLRLFRRRLEALPAGVELKDPKTRLQEWLQGRGQEPPTYRVVEVSGKEHAQQFKVVCLVTGVALSFDGQGSSRRRAEQHAAQQALNHLENRES